VERDIFERVEVMLGIAMEPVAELMPHQFLAGVAVEDFRDLMELDRLHRLPSKMVVESALQPAEHEKAEHQHQDRAQKGSAAGMRAVAHCTAE